MGPELRTSQKTLVAGSDISPAEADDVNPHEDFISIFLSAAYLKFRLDISCYEINYSQKRTFKGGNMDTPFVFMVL